MIGWWPSDSWTMRILIIHVGLYVFKNLANPTETKTQLRALRSVVVKGSAVLSIQKVKLSNPKEENSV